jgi:membrane-associated HD superfamily phosphohydrolase
MRSFICAVHFVCAQWLKKVDPNNTQTGYKASVLIGMVLSIYIGLFALFFCFDYVKLLTDSVRNNLIVFSALYLGLISGGMNLVIGNASDYKIRVRKRVNKKVIKHYTLGLKLWIFGLIPYFITLVTIFILNSN